MEVTRQDVGQQNASQAARHGADVEEVVLEEHRGNGRQAHHEDAEDVPLPTWDIVRDGDRNRDAQIIVDGVVRIIVFNIIIVKQLGSVNARLQLLQFSFVGVDEIIDGRSEIFSIIIVVNIINLVVYVVR